MNILGRIFGMKKDMDYVSQELAYDLILEDVPTLQKQLDEHKEFMKEAQEEGKEMLKVFKLARNRRNELQIILREDLSIPTQGEEMKEFMGLQERLIKMSEVLEVKSTQLDTGEELTVIYTKHLEKGKEIEWKRAQQNVDKYENRRNWRKK